MHRATKRSALFLVMALGVGLIGQAPARAQTTYDIEVGFEFPRESGIPGFSSRFYPPSIKIHRGDILHFRGSPGLFLPLGTGPEEFREENMIRLGDPYFPLLADPDDGADALKLNLAAFEPSVENCGQADTPCTHNGQGVLNTGDRARQFSVTIDVAAPAVLWIHSGFGTQTMRIQVVGANDAASTQSELDERAARLKRQDLATGAGLHGKLSRTQTSHRRADGTRIVDAYGGFDSGPVNLLAFYPKKIRIRRGDIVQWHWNLENEIHSAAFPLAKTKSILQNNFSPWCDPDGDGGDRRDNPPEGETRQAPPCNDMSQFEVDMDPRERSHARGNGTFGGPKDFEYSGLRITESVQPGFGNEKPWSVRFNARSGDEGWKYFCTIHGGFMGGTVVVR